MILALLAGCDFFASGPTWQEQRDPSGPCYAFDLRDGVESGANEELHAIFACLNRQGMLHAFERADLALDEPTRSGTVGASLVGALSAAGRMGEVPVSSLLSDVLAAFDDRAGTMDLVDLALEWAYAVGVEELGTAVTVNSTTSLRAGVFLPFSESLGAAATRVLDDDLVALGPLSRALRSEEAPRWVWSLALAPDAPDAGLAGIAEGWTLTLAQLLEDAGKTSNNRHGGATGNSLRDGAEALLEANALPTVLAAGEAILDDAHTRDALARWVEEEATEGRLQDVDDGLLYLASVDRLGGSLADGEDSALVSLLRLLHDANQPVDCRIDLFVTDIEWSLGNLSVAILEVIAATDPDTAASGVDILGDALGYPLTGGILDTIADSGVCPVIDRQLVDDLDAVDRLSDPPAENLLASLIGLLQATDDHTEALVDVIGAVHEAALVEPLEELVFDLAGSAAADHLLAAIPALLDPDGRQAAEAFPAGVEPVDVHAVATLLLALAEADTWEAIAPPLRVLVEEQATWDALANARGLLTRSGTVTERALPMFAGFVKAGPDLPWLTGLADVLDEGAVVEPAIGLVEVGALRAALLDTELLAEGPVPWLAQLRVGGTLDQLWDTLALFRPLLGDADA